MAVLAEMPQHHAFASFIIFGSHIFNRLQRRLIDNTRCGEINDNCFGIILDLKQLTKASDGPKEKRALDVIDDGTLLANGRAFGGVNMLGHIPGIDKRRHDHTHNNGDGQILNHSHKRHHNDHQRIRPRHPPHRRNGMPCKGSNNDHEHHADKGGDGNLFNQGRGKQDKGQKKQRRCNARNAGAPTRFHIDHRLTNHGTAAHTSEKASHQIGCTLRQTFLRCAATLFRHLANKVQRQQAFNQANRSQN